MYHQTRHIDLPETACPLGHIALLSLAGMSKPYGNSYTIKTGEQYSKLYPKCSMLYYNPHNTPILNLPFIIIPPICPILISHISPQVSPHPTPLGGSGVGWVMGSGVGTWDRAWAIERIILLLSFLQDRPIYCVPYSMDWEG